MFDRLNRLPVRGWLVVWGMFGFGVLLGVRLIDLQLRQGSAWRELADQNRWFQQVVPAERGVLLDRYGEPLTLNQKKYFVLNEPNLVWSPRTPVSRAAALEALAGAVATSSSNSEMTGTEPQSGLTSKGLAGVGQPADVSPVDFTLTRLYPYTTTLAHVLGYVGPVTADDLKTQPELPLSDQVGRAGLEARVDAQLRGQAGSRQYEVDALGRKLRFLQQNPSQPGAAVQTTLDPSLSEVAAQAMGEASGAVVIFDAETGEVLTLLSAPSFDPNVFQPQTDAVIAASASAAAEQARKAQVTSYLQNPAKPLFNRAVAGEYPAGSIFKLVTAVAGLSEGKISADTVVVDTGVLQVGTYAYANWYFTQYGRTEGPINLHRAISRSNDIYFYKAAEAIGPTLLATWARRFGLGQPVGIEVAGEASGLVPDPAWKERHTGEPWYLGNTYHFGIGQGDLLVTPLQLAQLVQAVAAKGRLCRLHVLAASRPDCRELGVTDTALGPVRQGMVEACSPGGTAFPFFPINQAALSSAGAGGETGSEVTAGTALAAGAVACKTGTAEFGAPVNAAGHRPTHAWFVMFADLTQPLKLAQSISQEATSPLATQSAELNRPQTEVTDYQRWLQQINQTGWPRQLGMVVLVESSQAVPFAEGSREAGTVAKKIYDWMTTGKAVGPTPSSVQR